MTVKNHDIIEIDAKCVHETKNAYLLDYGGAGPVWVAKSLVDDNGDGTFQMPEWYALQKELI